MFYLKEAKIRFIYILFSFLFTLYSSYFFSDQLIYWSILPLKEAYFKNASHLGSNGTHASFHLIFTEVTELFFAQIKIACFITFIFSFPI